MSPPSGKRPRRIKNRGQFVFGLILAALGVFIVFNDDLTETGRRGVPMWLAGILLLGSGGYLAQHGARDKHDLDRSE